MKIIHTADIHLGSKFTSFPQEIRKQRQAELKATFANMVEYAKNNNVSIIMLCGDIFDSNTPSKKDKEFFYSIIKENKDIDFLYLKGNHDILASYEETYSNLKLFSNEWESYTYGDVVISGLEIRPLNKTSYYSTLNLDPTKKNIVMLHGQIGDSLNSDINLKKLQNKNIDYLALGHIHKVSEGKLDNRGKYVYCGCLEGRGFDETKRHGFYLLDIDKYNLKYEFVDFASRTIHEVNVDISPCLNLNEIKNKINSDISFISKDIYKINLVGELNFDVSFNTQDIKSLLEDKAFYLDVSDKTTRKIDVLKYKNDISIRGEFVRLVMSKNDLTEVEKNKIISLGLKTLDREEVEL